LDGSHPDLIAHAAAYQSTRVWTLRRVFQKLKQLDRPRLPEVFVDLGCGTGRACFFAASKGEFRAVHGVDFSQALIERARANGAAFRGPPVTFEYGDAAVYRLPNPDCLVFMFNPFDEVILGRFLELNAPSLRRGRGLVVYANDLHRSVLSEAGLTQLYRIGSRETSIWGWMHEVGG
jgi:SAM-dependent methyltransferase